LHALRRRQIPHNEVVEIVAAYPVTFAQETAHTFAHALHFARVGPLAT